MRTRWGQGAYLPHRSQLLSHGAAKTPPEPREPAMEGACRRGKPLQTITSLPRRMPAEPLRPPPSTVVAQRKDSPARGPCRLGAGERDTAGEAVQAQAAVPSSKTTGGSADSGSQRLPNGSLVERAGLISGDAASSSRAACGELEGGPANTPAHKKPGRRARGPPASLGRTHPAAWRLVPTDAGETAQV